MPGRTKNANLSLLVSLDSYREDDKLSNWCWSKSIQWQKSQEKLGLPYRWFTLSSKNTKSMDKYISIKTQKLLKAQKAK